MPVDWTACEQDVINEYVNGTKTAKETLQHIRQVHGVHATLRQFKWKFGGKKKLRADEWKVVISKIREREAEGKTSAVYLHGRRLPPDRVAREMRRYSKNCEVKNSDGIYLGVDTIDEHRLEIRDPEAPCSQLTIRASSNVPRGLTGFTMAQNLQELENPTGTTDWGIDPAFAVPVDFMDLDLSTPQLQDSPGFQIAHPQSPHNLSSLDLQRNRSSPTPCRAEMTPGAMVRTESCSSRRAQFHSPSEGPSFQIFPATSTIVAGSAEPLFPPFWDSKGMVF
ncbi:hypothetical protein QQZ08_001769 [Neonectria magnoliae]|uniref:Clr5 domain-containing protein n=1 Tax=Neonectria magnoliae TaxID=2732573 RepID=A0ABR1IFI0_9HYPO